MSNLPSNLLQQLEASVAQWRDRKDKAAPGSPEHAEATQQVENFQRMIAEISKLTAHERAEQN
jgi:hypothetical protein